MSGAETVVTFVVGFAAGGAVFWQARRDFRVARSGLRTLVEMMFRRGWDAARWLVVGAAAVGALVLLVANRGR